ncbi:hypothetical protein [Metabacillus idriensis]|uniref:hypothetical protein n=2 Tax=Metabacillus idriensis TaxID=324768 RepID=UPI00174D28AC|nr:hypothetical protein [Metabacillus idriensis]
MSKQITPIHLAFIQEAKEAFESSSTLETYSNKDDYEYIALRFGADRDCIMVYELGDAVANFVQQMDPKPGPRIEVRQFAYEMEEQLKVNDHKRGWSKEHHEFLSREIGRNHELLRMALLSEDHDKFEITKRCANIANFAMMIADNYGNLEGGND